MDSREEPEDGVHGQAELANSSRIHQLSVGYEQSGMVLIDHLISGQTVLLGCDLPLQVCDGLTDFDLDGMGLAPVVCIYEHLDGL